MLTKEDLQQSERDWEAKYERMMPGSVTVQIPTSKEHWDNVMKSINLWLNATNLPEVVSPDEIQDLINQTRLNYGDVYAQPLCHVIWHLQRYGCDKEIIRILNSMPNLMNNSLRNQLKELGFKIPGSIFDTYFLYDMYCSRILRHLRKRGMRKKLTS